MYMMLRKYSEEKTDLQLILDYKKKLNSVYVLRML